MNMEKRKASVIIQARMGSTRLPGKVMREVLGKPLIGHMIDRSRRAEFVDRIIVATSIDKANDALCDYLASIGVDVFRGSEHDVLERFYQAAKKYDLKYIVRLTADCPLIDPQVIDEVIHYYLEHPEYDLVRSGPTYPEGFDTEVFSFRSLEIAWKESRLKSEREHVTSYLWKNDTRFKIKTLAFDQNLSYLRMTVDEEVDFQVVKSILENLYKKGEMFYLEDILCLYQEKPYLFELNQKVIRNEGYLKSLVGDSKVK